MKKPVFLTLIGIGVVLLVVGIVFVVPWFGKMMEEMEQLADKHVQHRRTLRMSAREPLTDEQEKLLSQLLEIVGETGTSQNPNDLEEALSSEPYLAYIKAQEGEDYENFRAYVDAIPTENMKTIALSRIKATLGTDKGDTELDVWMNYYFIVREWGITVEDPRDNIKELNELHQTHLIAPLMESDSEVSDLHTQIVQIGMSSIFMTEDNKVFKDVWRERIETYGEQAGLLRCAIAAPGEFALIRSFFADMGTFQEWILTRPEPEAQESDTPLVDSTPKKAEQPVEQTAPVVEDTFITTPQSINRVAKKLDWFASPESQNLKVGDFIVVIGQPNGYIGAIEEPFGDRLFPTFKLTYAEPCHQFFIEHWIYPAQGEICSVLIKSDVNFTKIRDVRKYNRARQLNMDNDDWLENRGLTIIAKIEELDYGLYNDELGNKWSIDAIYVHGDMLRY